MNNLNMMRKRLEWQGGVAQEDRMIKDKFRTLQRVLQYSYQACTVQKVQPVDSLLPYDDELKGFADRVEERFPQVRALINPDKVKQDYDDKVISLPYENNYVPGDVFTWGMTSSYWLIYTRELTEDAYFRGEIRRCRHKINFKDEKGIWRSTWAAIRGPVETQIVSIQKNQIREDTPNLSLSILMPLNEYTRSIFQRYTEFLFADRCWQVQTHNDISMAGVLEVIAEEYYIDRDMDDYEQAMKNGLEFELAPEPNDPVIQGDAFITAGIPQTYKCLLQGGTWKIKEDKIPATLKPIDNQTVEVTWHGKTHGNFTLVWTDGATTREKAVVAQTLL